MPAPKDPVAYLLWKKHMSESRKGEKNGNYGKPVSEDRKQKQRNKMIGKMAGEKNPMYGIRLTGEKNHQFGKPLSESTKDKLSISHTGIKFSADHKIKLSETKLGTKNPFFGKTHSEDAIKIISQPKTHAHKIKISAIRQGVPLDKWEGFISQINHYVRTHKRYKDTCFDAMKDVGFKDEFTGSKGLKNNPLECHHIIPHNIIMKIYNITTREQADNCSLLFDKHNLIVMIKSAHDKFHNLYGDDKNVYELTPEQIKELYVGV